MRVLLVEDNRPLADWLAKALRQSRFVVDCMHDGADADHVLRTQDYAVVLLDVSLPRMDGWEVLRRLRARQPRAGAAAHRPRRRGRPRARAGSGRG